MSGIEAKRFVDEYKEFDKYMSTGKTATTIRYLNEEAKVGVPSLTVKVNKKTVLNVLREKHPEPRN